MTGRCTQGKRFDVRGAFDGVWVHGKSPVLGIGDTESLKDRTGRGGGEVSVMDSIEERYEEQIAALKHERDGYLNGQQQMQDTCSSLQDSTAKYAEERKALKRIIDGLREEKERIEILANELHEQTSSNGVYNLINQNTKIQGEVEKLKAEVKRLRDALIDLLIWVSQEAI